MRKQTEESYPTKSDALAAMEQARKRRPDAEVYPSGPYENEDGTWRVVFDIYTG